jgi:hypothetical protein
VSPERVSARGVSVFRGGERMPPSRPDGMYSTPELARLLRKSPATIRSWRRRGWLAPQGLDERGNPLHTAEAGRAAEQLTRRHGLEASGVDPRRLRGRTREPETTQADAGIAA